MRLDIARLDGLIDESRDLAPNDLEVDLVIDEVAATSASSTPRSRFAHIKRRDGVAAVEPPKPTIPIALGSSRAIAMPDVEDSSLPIDQRPQANDSRDDDDDESAAVLVTSPRRWFAVATVVISAGAALAAALTY